MEFEINQLVFSLIIFASSIVMWVGFLTLLGKVTGWNKLAKQLVGNTASKMVGSSNTTFRFVSGTFNKTQYKGCLTVITSQYGLTLKVGFPFFFGHKPLVLPWDKIENLTAHKSTLMHRMHLKLLSPLKADITLPATLFLKNPHVPERLMSPNYNTTEHANPYQ